MNDEQTAIDNAINDETACDIVEIIKRQYPEVYTYTDWMTNTLYVFRNRDESFIEAKAIVIIKRN